MTTPDTTHECPAPGCTRRLPFHILACRDHWRRLPRDLQRAVTRSWSHGPTEAYALARADAVEWWEQNP